MAEEMKDHLIGSFMYLFIRRQLFIVLDAYGCEYKLRQLCEYRVIVVLTDRKVDIVTTDHVEEYLTKLFDVLPLALILVTLHLFASEAIPKLQQLDHILGCLFEYYKSIDTPGVKSNSVLSVQHEFSEELKCNENDLIVSVERIESPFNDVREVVRIEPVKENVERLRIIATPHNTSQDVEKFHYIVSGALGRLHSSWIHRKEMLNLRCKLFQIAWKLCNKFISDPETD